MQTDTEIRTDAVTLTKPMPAATLAPPATVASTPYTKSPIAALLLSVFPGIGQIYNGQPAKAFVFFFAWVSCMYLTAEVGPMPFALLIPFTYFYNLVDAYRSAAALRARGVVEPEPEPESPAWGGTLVGLGFLLLLNNLGLLRLAALRPFWPVLLIAAGAWFVHQARRPAAAPEVRDADAV